MKAILVIDMPNKCEECPLHYRKRQEIYRCEMTHKNIRLNSKPSWCLLKPLPPKLDANDWHRMFSGLFSEREAKGHGWNACLKEITGE